MSISTEASIDCYSGILHYANLQAAVLKLQYFGHMARRTAGQLV